MQMKNSLTGTCPIVDNKPSVREPFSSGDLRDLQDGRAAAHPRASPRSSAPGACGMTKT